ncbi:hypothetical protein [Thalassovita taeanensis]|uniref:Uncharacterized protein n=1 Tax=Thalassovita taeanensis TaxID=657014 RepID=A0A1H9JV50_9RHOB|nr:hypothetical protein [Thalassovita taeanensis]SEQ90634.1 hypothetical protein SAMN04488092_11641 [Thalassovita taeanensis]
MALVNTETARRLMSALGTDSGRKAFLGDGTRYDAVPATKIMKLHHSVDDAVKRVNALEWDKTRTPPQQHQAGRKIAEATVAEINKTRDELKAWVAKETADAMEAIETALSPDIGTAAQVVRSEIRAFILSKRGDPEFVGELRGLVETDIRFATALFEAPAALSGMSSERLNTLRLYAAAAHAPEASERVRIASEVAALDGKLASVAAEVPRSFFDGGIEKGMATRVEIDTPLATGE